MPPAKGQRVKVHYRGTLEDGSEFDSSAGHDPLEFVCGDGQVIQGFDDAVAGMSVGETITVTIPAEEAYGPHYDEAVHTVALEMFGEEPSEGDVVGVIAPDGTELAATVVSRDGESATLDFNHPLAGQDLTFELELVEICA